MAVMLMRKTRTPMMYVWSHRTGLVFMVSLSTLGFLQDSRDKGVKDAGASSLLHEEFRAVAVIAPRTEIFDLALSEHE
jgi:hypothetical protein